MQKFVDSNLLTNEEKDIYNQLSNDEKYHYLLELDKFNSWYQTKQK